MSLEIKKTSIYNKDFTPSSAYPDSAPKAPQQIARVWSKMDECFPRVHEVLFSQSSEPETVSSKSLTEETVSFREPERQVLSFNPETSGPEVVLSPDRKKLIPLLSKLGVSQSDGNAHDLLIPMLQKAFNRDVQITPSENPEDSGVYYLSLDGKKFAVFKVGEKRATTELFVRSVAHKAGLEKHAVPGLFCSIANPTFPSAPTIVELWNGNQKVYTNAIDDEAAEDSYNEAVRNDNNSLQEPFTLTGILEPFIPIDAKTSPDDFAQMVSLALLIGLRDGKTSGVSGSMLFDTEDSWPARLLPSSSPDKKVAATHLPLLEDPLASVPMSRKVIENLADKVNDIQNQIFTWLNDLAKEEVRYPDLSSEDLMVPDPDVSNANLVSFLTDIPELTLQKLTFLLKLSDEDLADYFGCPLEYLKENNITSKNLNILRNLDSQDLSRDLEIVNKQSTSLVDSPVLRVLKGLKEAEKFKALQFLRSGWDHGGCPVVVEKTKQILNDRVAHKKLDSRKPESFKLLSGDQLNACAARISNLNAFLQYCKNHPRKSPTPIDMVRAVDLQYDAHLRSLEKANLDRQSPYDVVGRFSPHAREYSAPFTAEDRMNILEASSREPTPSPSPRSDVSPEFFERGRHSTSSFSLSSVSDTGSTARPLPDMRGFEPFSQVVLTPSPQKGFSPIKVADPKGFRPGDQDYKGN